jgi:hypothetical protein
MRKLFFLLLLFLLLTISLSAQDTILVNPQYSYTHHQPTGNRTVEGQGTFPNVNVTDFMLDTVPHWVIGNPMNLSDVNTIAWTVALQNGQVQGGLSSGDNFTIDDRYRLSNTPLLINQSIAQAIFVHMASNDESTLTHPIFFENARHVYVAQNGDLVYVRDGEERSRLALNVPLDARIVVNENGRIAVYAPATDERYVHGIMGDDIEGSSLVVLEVRDDKLEVFTQIDLEGDAVYEGLSPIWADVDGDTMPDLITTVSDSQNGSRIRVYRLTYDGIRIAEGEPIGTSHRWQHQLAFAPFGVNGEMELVDVLTPHIGGIVRFYQFNGREMEIVAQIAGYTSHVIGSRNLDMAVAGDFNGDGRPEIVLPSQDRTRIAGIQHNENGAEVVWELPLAGVLSTNLAAIQMVDGQLALASGTEEGRLRVWLSQP